MTQLSAAVLADAPRIWQTVGPDMRVRVICPKWRARTIAELEATETRRLTIENAKAQLAELQTSATLTETLMIEKLLDIVCVRYGITRAELVSSGRTTALVDARTEAARRLRAKGTSICAIGRALERDHTTVLHALRKPPRD